MAEETTNNNASETQVTPSTEQAKTYTQEEVNKMIQSEKSSAKYEILNSLGITSVAEFQAQKTELEQKAHANEEAKAQLDNLQKEFDNYKKDSFAKSLGINDTQMTDFKTLVNSKVDDTHTFEDVAKSVYEQYFKKVSITQTAIPNATTSTAGQKIETGGWK